MNLLDIHHILFVCLGYQMSYIEFFAVITGLIAVYLSAIEHISNWIIGLFSVALMAILFYQIQLYPDLFLQVFFFITNIIGWWKWKNPKAGEENQNLELKISNIKPSSYLLLTSLVLVSSILLGFFSSNLHHLLPHFFSLPSAYPYIDSFTTILSVLATFLLIQKKLEAWFIWIIVDIICTLIYYLKEVKFLSLEYLIFTVIAIFGFLNWRNIYLKHKA